MPIISACCCYESLKDGSRACAVYTFVTGLVNACIAIWLIVVLHGLVNSLEPNEQWNFLPPGMLVFMYIQLACSLAMLGLAFELGVAINRIKTCRATRNTQIQGQGLIRLWTGVISGFRIYEVFIGMYTLIWLGAHRISDVLFIAPYFNFIIFYWVLNTVVMVVAIICVQSYLQECLNEVYGKEHRVKYYTMLANVRAAGLKSRGIRSGLTTPYGYHSSRHTLLAPSQGSGPIGYSSQVPSYHPSQSSTRPSTSSYPEKEYPQTHRYGAQTAYQPPQQQAYYPPHGKY